MYFLRKNKKLYSVVAQGSPFADRLSFSLVAERLFFTSDKKERRVEREKAVVSATCALMSSSNWGLMSDALLGFL